MRTNVDYILDRNGRLLWNRNNLGAIDTTAATFNSYASQATAIANNINSGGSRSQTEVGAVSKTVAKSAGLAAGILTSLGGAGAIATVTGLTVATGGLILVVLGAVVAAALLVDAIFGSSKDKANMEQAGQYNQLNTVLRQQIMQVDQKTKGVADGLAILNDALKSKGLAGLAGSHSSLGSYSSDVLNAAIASNADLKRALAQKTSALESLIKNFNTTVQNTYDAITGQSRGQKFILWGLLGLAASGLAWYGYKTLIKHEKV